MPPRPPAAGTLPRPAVAAFAVVAVAALLGHAAPAARAVNFTWNNLTQGNWNDGNNWTPAGPPGANDTPFINNGGTAVIDDTQTVATGFVVLADTTGSTGNLRMTGGMLTTNFDLRVGGNAATGGGTGKFDFNGGTIFMNGGNVNVGFGTTAVGTFNVGPAGLLTVNSATIFAVGNRGTGTVNQTGGTVFVRGASAPAAAVVQLGRNTATVPSSGTYTLSGGLLTVQNLQYGNAAGGAGSTNVFNLQGSGSLRVGTISVLNTGATNTFNFAGGTLAATSVQVPLTNAGGALAPATVNFDTNSITSPVGTTTFTGTNGYTQGPAGRLAIDLAAPGSADLVDVGAGAPVGTASLAGTIDVSTVGGFDPAVGATFDVLTADTITNTAAVAGLTPGGNGYAASVVAGGDGRQVLRLTVVPVPEPAGRGAMAAAAAGGLLARRRRRHVRA